MTVLETIDWIGSGMTAGPGEVLHARVIAYMKDHSTIEGEYRARIRSADSPFFDWRNGKAIWVTNIVEHFLDIEDIERLEVLA